MILSLHAYQVSGYKCTLKQLLVYDNVIFQNIKYKYYTYQWTSNKYCLGKPGNL